MEGEKPLSTRRARLRDIWDRLTRPQAVNEDEARREYMVRVILVLSLAALLLFTVIIVIGWLKGGYTYEPVLMMFLTDITFGAGLGLAHIGRWRLAGFIPPAAFFILGLLSTSQAGLITTTALLYVLAIMLTALLLGSRVQWYMVAMSILAQVGIGWMVDPHSPIDLIPPTITVTGAFIGVALLQSFFASQFQRALESARAYAEELKNYRDQLEGLVRKRTAALRMANDELQKEVLERQQTQIALKAAHDQLEVRVEERTAELTIMLEASRAVSSTLDFDEVLNEIAKQMVMAIMVSRAVIYQFELETDQLVPWAEWRRDQVKDQLPSLAPIPLTEYPMYRRPLETRQPATVKISDPDLSPQEINYLSISGSKRELLLPLTAGEKIFGLVIMADGNEAQDFTPSEIRLCEALSDQAGITIENANLHAETKRRSERLAALHNIDNAITASMDLKFTLNLMLEQMINQLGVDAASVLLSHHFQKLKFAAGRGFRTPGIEGTLLRFGEGLAGQAALDRRLISVSDLRSESLRASRTRMLIEEEFTSYIVAPLISKGEVMGVIELFSKDPLEPDEEWLSFLETISNQAAIAIHNARHLDQLEVLKTGLEVAYGETLEILVQSLDHRAQEPPGHSKRVVDSTMAMAFAMNLPSEKLIHISRGALLHDVGKLAVPEHILTKPGPLTKNEWLIIQQHPLHAFNMLSKIQFLRPALEIPYCHHERWDGTGYPRRITGEDIPLEARIFSVVETWDILTADRPYRRAWSAEKTRVYLQEQMGKRFDPQVVEAFLAFLNEESLFSLSDPVPQTP